VNTTWAEPKKTEDTSHVSAAKAQSDESCVLSAATSLRLLNVSCGDAALNVSLLHTFRLHVPLMQLCQVKSIFVGGLPDTVSEEKLQDVFKVYGEVGCTASKQGLQP